MLQAKPLRLFPRVRSCFGEGWLRPETLSNYLPDSTGNSLQQLTGKERTLGGIHGHKNFSEEGLKAIEVREKLELRVLS